MLPRVRPRCDRVVKSMVVHAAVSGNEERVTVHSVLNRRYLGFGVDSVTTPVAKLAPWEMRQKERLVYVQLSTTPPRGGR